MDETPAVDTRGRILRAALDLFAARGYQRTSLREIADRLRLTKAAILYHYPSKEHLLAALAEPLLADLEAALDSAAGLPAPAARWAAIEGWLDTLLAHRRPLGMLYHDMTLLSRGSACSRIMRVAMRAYDLVAGPDATPLERVRAVQAIAMIGDPIVFFIDIPLEQLRADMLDGVRRLLPERPPPDPIAAAHPGTTSPAGPVRRRRAGRPRAMSGEQVGAARAMHAAGSHTVDQIAASLGVSRATVYRHLHLARTTASP